MSHPQSAGPAGATSADAAQLPAGGATPTAGVYRWPRGRAASRTSPRAALITGCSSGIGHAADYHVYATARRPESLVGLAAAGSTTARLDVTEEESMATAVGQISAAHGAVAILVNNAGFELAGPVEEIPLAEARRLFDTHLFGLTR